MMNKLIITLMCALFFSLSMTAQVEADSVGTTRDTLATLTPLQNFNYHRGCFYLDSLKLSTNQLRQVVGEAAYNDFKTGRRLRTAGKICIGVGCCFTALELLCFVGAARSADSGGAIGVAFGVGTGLLFGTQGAICLVAGAIIKHSGVKKLRRIKPAYDGIGVALTF